MISRTENDGPASAGARRASARRAGARRGSVAENGVDDARTEVGAPSYLHLARLSDPRGLFEHALYDIPRQEHGYCVDDVARGLLVVIAEPDQTPLLGELTETYLRFVIAAIEPDGSAHNRMGLDGEWTDESSNGDWWGRAVWALGFAAASAPLPLTRRRALRAFTVAAAHRSPHLRAMSFAAIGAAEVLRVSPGLTAAAALIEEAAEMIPPGDLDWPWPERRLAYGNGSIAEALISGGQSLGDIAMVARGLELLVFLLRVETVSGHLSVTGSRGRGADETGRLYDQQPIEVAAIADACSRAFAVTGDAEWLAGVRMAWKWFTGDNDGGTPMYDAISGAGYDGLQRRGRNENRGAESTLAALSTYQRARAHGQIEVTR